MTSMSAVARPWRCFWAVPLPAELRASLAAFVARCHGMSGVDDAWRFTDDDGRHLTVAFLGAIDQEVVEPMTARVRDALSAFEPFDITAGGLGGFPRDGRARVMWYGIADSSRRLSALASAVQSACGLELDEPFRPHVTLARSRDRRGAALPSPSEPPPTAELRVADVVLFRSHIGAGPARYEELARVTLGAPKLATATP